MHLPRLVNLIPFPPRFFMNTLTSSCRPSRTSSTHLLPLALYHVIWRQPSSNLCWKSHHLTKIFWKTTVPFLTYHCCPNSWKGRSPQTSLPSPRKQLQQSLSVSLSSRIQHWDRFVTYCKRYSFRSRHWQHFCSFVESFCRLWHYWPPNSPLPPELCFWHSVYCTPMVSLIPLRHISVHFSQ